MYGNHPMSRIQKSEIKRNKRASDGAWRTRDTTGPVGTPRAAYFVPRSVVA